ncbi:MAG TPA: hypothetical protein VN414_07235 [Methanosarcina sp.]|nr:hypothetical protein [Methanosarcina sp.]
MAQGLIWIALDTGLQLTIAAQTLPEENEPTAILKKLGFQFAAELENSEDGKIWEWQLKNSSRN